jgi:hypothetical protein
MARRLGGTANAMAQLVFRARRGLRSSLRSAAA